MTIWKFTDKEPVRVDVKGGPGGASDLMPEHDCELSGKADALIAEGNYIRAMEIYRSLLSRYASNKYLLQRFEELKSLILLSGMRKDLITSRLARFLEMIKKRGRERQDQAI